MTIGCLEQVTLPELIDEVVWAKVDTGAYSGALHCTDIKVVKRGPEKQPVLQFTPLGNDKLATETTDFLITYVRSSTGHRVRRYVIDTVIKIRGQKLPIRIGLSDRNKMKRPVLIGRRFLRANHILVDVQINHQYDDEGDSTR